MIDSQKEKRSRWRSLYRESTISATEDAYLRYEEIVEDSRKAYH